ncbi:MAG TPA: S8 family serine peptidase [Roseiflexaceae bacterium]
MEPPSWPTPPAASNQPNQPGCLAYILLFFAAAWVVVIAILVQGGIWFYDQVRLIQGQPMPTWYWLLAALGQALLLALPIVPLALATRAPRLRAAYRMWALAIGFGALFSLPRLFPVTWTQPAALAQIILALLATIGLRILRARNAELRKEPHQFSLLALALGLLAALPWFRYGALGSPLDTLLNLLAGLALGLFAGALLDAGLVEPLAAHTTAPASEIALGGVAAGIALLALGAGFGYGGSQLLLPICLAPLGGAAIAIGRLAGPGGARRAIGGLVGVAAAAPLMFVDPDEFSLLLGSSETWLPVRTAFFSLLIAVVIGLALWVLSARIAGPPRRGVALGALAATTASALLIYFFAGQPGFYGEQLFVILRDQADVSQATSIADRTERLRYVYTTLTQQAERTQAGLRATLDRLGVEYHPYYLVNGIEVNGGLLLRAYLAAQPEVDRILDSPHLRPLPIPKQPDVAAPDFPPDPDTFLVPSGVAWNIGMIGADRVWNEFHITGQGIVVGEADSGVQGDHPALRDGYRGRDGQNDYNWLDPWNHTRAPTDVGGHGTHTTGTIVGRGGTGVAPGAEWIGCVNLARNLGNPPLYLNCMQFMLAPYAQGGDSFTDGDPARAAHVLNNSWGCPPLEGCDANSLAPATRALRAAGIFVAASAGNEGPRCGSVSDPIAIYDDVFSVGAVNRSGDVASFSSRGPVTADGSGRIKPDILAPGVNVISSLPGSTYGPESGTSMAGPHVAGVVALLWSAQSKLIGDIDRTEQILIQTARPYSGQRTGCFEGEVPNDGAGYGLVDAYAAVKSALEIK